MAQAAGDCRPTSLRLRSNFLIGSQAPTFKKVSRYIIEAISLSSQDCGLCTLKNVTVDLEIYGNAAFDVAVDTGNCRVQLPDAGRPPRRATAPHGPLFRLLILERR